MKTLHFVLVFFCMSIYAVVSQAQVRNVEIIESRHGSFSYADSSHTVGAGDASSHIRTDISGMISGQDVAIFSGADARSYNGTYVRLKYVGTREATVTVVIQGDAYASISGAINDELHAHFEEWDRAAVQQYLVNEEGMQQTGWGFFEKKYVLQPGQEIAITVAMCNTTHSCSAGVGIRENDPPVEDTPLVDNDDTPVVQKDSVPPPQPPIKINRPQAEKFELEVWLDMPGWPWWYYALLVCAFLLGVGLVGLALGGPEEKKDEKRTDKMFGNKKMFSIIFLFILSSSGFSQDSIQYVFASGARQDVAGVVSIPDFKKEKDIKNEDIPIADVTTMNLAENGEFVHVSQINVDGTNPITGYAVRPPGVTTVYQLFSGINEKAVEAKIILKPGKYTTVWCSYIQTPGHGPFDDGGALFLHKRCFGIFFANKYSKHIDDAWVEIEEGIVTKKWYEMPLVIPEGEMDTVVIQLSACSQGAHGSILWFGVKQGLPTPTAAKDLENPTDSAIVTPPDGLQWQWYFTDEDRMVESKLLKLPKGTHDMKLRFTPLAGCPLDYDVTVVVKQELPPFPWKLALILGAIGGGIYFIIFLFGWGKDRMKKKPEEKELFSEKKSDTSSIFD